MPMKFARIQFESTNYCSMKCEFCPNRKMTRERKNLDSELFKKIIDDIAKNALTETISFAGNGEPLIDPHLADKLEYCKTKKLKTVITTNGLQMEKINPKIIANLDCLYISWQTFNEKTFKLRGTNLDYQIYKNKLIEFIKQNKDKLKIVISLMLNENKRWFTRDLMGANFKDLLNQNLKDFLPIAGEISDAARKNLERKLSEKRRLSFQEIELDNNLFLNIDQFSDWGGNLSSYSQNFQRIPAETGQCRIMAAGPLVLSDGRLSLCCVDYDGNVTIGNLQKENFSDIINSERYKKIFENFQNKVITLPYCRQCLGRWESKNKFKHFLYRAENKIYHLIHYKNKR
jgi:MoaA/NifB/PqqE/SkfB family radical SAM enzyme